MSVPTAKEESENCPKPLLFSANSVNVKNVKPQDAAPVNVVFPAHQAQLDVTDAMAHLVTLVNSDHLATPYHSVMNTSRNSPNNAHVKHHPAVTEKLVALDSPELPEITVNQETQAPQEIKDNLEIPAVMATKETQDKTVNPETPVLLPPRNPETLESLVAPAPTVPLATPEHLDHPETTETMALLANPETPDSLANLATPANPVAPEMLEIPEQQAVAISVHQLVWLLDINLFNSNKQEEESLPSFLHHTSSLTTLFVVYTVIISSSSVLNL